MYSIAVVPRSSHRIDAVLFKHTISISETGPQSFALPFTSLWYDHSNLSSSSSLSSPLSLSPASSSVPEASLLGLWVGGNGLHCPQSFVKSMPYHLSSPYPLIFSPSDLTVCPHLYYTSSIVLVCLFPCSALCEIDSTVTGKSTIIYNPITKSTAVNDKTIYS